MEVPALVPLTVILYHESRVFMPLTELEDSGGMAHKKLQGIQTMTDSCSTDISLTKQWLKARVSEACQAKCGGTVH